MPPPIDLQQAAWQLAARYHRGQSYAQQTAGVSLPYLTHLGAVTFEVQAAVGQEPSIDAHRAVLGAIFHDLLEDTDCPPEHIRRQFGDEVLAVVRALTKDEALPTKQEQMADSLRRIALTYPEAAVIKLADRICNLGPPPHYWSVERARAYAAEARSIHAALAGTSPYLAGRLQERIEAYERQFISPNS